MLSPLLTFGALLLAADSSSAGAPERAEDEWTRSYPIAPGGRVELVNVNGSISAEPAAGAQLELVAKRTAKARTQDGARELLGRIEMREDVSGPRVRVEVRPPSSFGGGTQVRWTVRVPKGIAVDLRTENGSVSMEGLDAAVRAETVNGSVRGEALEASSVDASSVNGAVDIALAAPLAGDGKIALETTNGRVALALPAASRATLAAEVVNGSIDADGAAFEFKKKSRTEVEATLNGGGASVTLETVNGGASVKLEDTNGSAGAATSS